MSNREIFINEMNEAINSGTLTLSEEAMAYFTESTESKAVDITEKGLAILEYMAKNNGDCGENKFTASAIGEGVFCTGRSVAGSMRKLIASGYAEKEVGGKSVIYSITALGKEKIGA